MLSGRNSDSSKSTTLRTRCFHLAIPSVTSSIQFQNGLFWSTFFSRALSCTADRLRNSSHRISVWFSLLKWYMPSSIFFTDCRQPFTWQLYSLANGSDGSAFLCSQNLKSPKSQTDKVSRDVYLHPRGIPHRDIYFLKWPMLTSSTERNSPISTKINWKTFWGKFGGIQWLPCIMLLIFWNIPWNTQHQTPTGNCIAPVHCRNENWSLSMVSSVCRSIVAVTGNGLDMICQLCKKSWCRYVWKDTWVPVQYTNITHS